MTLEVFSDLSDSMILQNYKCYSFYPIPRAKQAKETHFAAQEGCLSHLTKGTVVEQPEKKESYHTLNSTPLLLL